MAEEKNITAKKVPAKAQKQEKPVKKKKPSRIKRFMTFIREVKSELRKVVWPTPKQVVNNTTVVVVVIILSASFISLVDWLFKFAAGFLAR